MQRPAKAPGRPFWRMPRRLVIGEQMRSGTWATLPSAAKSVLLPLQIFTDGTRTGVAIDRLAKCIGCKTTVCRGLSELDRRGLIERERRWSVVSGNVSSLTTISPSLIAEPRERVAFFSREVVIGGAWASLTPAGRALYVVLLCGVHGDGFRAWTSTPEARRWATDGGLDPEDGDPRFTPEGEANPDHKPGGFDWLRFVGDMTRTRTMPRKLLADLPYVSLRKHDGGAIGIGTLAKYSGLSENAVRSGIESLAASRLAFVIRPPVSPAHRFVLPDRVRWMADPDFLPLRAFEYQTPVADGMEDTPF